MKPAVVIAEAADTVPLMVRTPNPFDEFRILTVVPAPLIVTVLEGPVNVEPTPEVSQFPATAHVPEAVTVPADPDPLVDEFVQEPLKVHVAPPKLTNPVSAMLTLPLIVFVPAAPAVSPPAIFAASVAAVSVNVLLARTAPAFTVRVPDTSTSPVWVTVPAAEIVRLLKLFAAFKIAMLLTPLIVTVLVPFV